MSARRDITVAKPPKYDRKKEIRAIARERVGSVQPSRVIKPKTERKQPKHKQVITAESELP